jgi:catechol 2,3-dioxygenase-like lactoylglutathione lyase family enzyme
VKPSPAHGDASGEDAAGHRERLAHPRPRLDHCVIAISDWDRSVAFYRDVLLAEIVEQPGGRVAFRLGDQQLNVHGPGRPGRPDPVGEMEARIPVAPGGSDLCFTWPGTVDQALAHLSRLGVGVEAGPVPRHGGRGPGTSLYVRDPDGSLLELIVYADGA